MSNKIVVGVIDCPVVYRSIIDDVIENIRVDFEEYGMEEEILLKLQAKWEANLLETRVADFARAPRQDDESTPEGDARPTGPPGSNIVQHPPGSGIAMPGNGMGYMAPQYPHSQGLALPGMSRPMNGSGVPGQNGYGDVRVKQEVDDVLRPRGGAGEEDIKPRIEPNAAGLMPGDEIIDSDLDDSDREEGEDDDEEGDADIVFCVWDKVQRVKNKWKTTFKDGMIHINGRDYLFQKCSGEFEW